MDETCLLGPQRGELIFRLFFSKFNEFSVSNLFNGINLARVDRFVFAGVHTENPSPTSASGVDVRVKRKCQRLLNSVSLFFLAK